MQSVCWSGFSSWNEDWILGVLYRYEDPGSRSKQVMPSDRSVVRIADFGMIVTSVASSVFVVMFADSTRIFGVGDSSVEPLMRISGPIGDSVDR